MPEPNDKEKPSTPAADAPTQPTMIAGIEVPAEHVEFYQKIYERLKLDADQRLLIWKQDELNKVQTELDDKVKDLVAEFMAQWKEEQKPMTQEQIQTLLSQEYVTFDVEIVERKSRVKRKFTLIELPQSIEEKFCIMFKERLKEYGPQIAAYVQANMDKSFEDQIGMLADGFSHSMKVIGEAVAICLNPFGEEEGIDRDWVCNNLTSQRMWSILHAQMEVNKLRDFFSQLFQAGQKMQMMSQPLSFQGLQARVR